MPIVDGKCKLTLNATSLESLLDTVPDHSSAHESAGSDPVDVKNLAGFSGNAAQFLNGAGNFSAPTASVTYGTTAGTSCEGNDGRLSNSRAPTAHKATHSIGQADALSLSDILTLSGVNTQYLNGTGAFSTPSSGSSLSYPGSGSVFLNGLGSWTIPSASGSVFKPWVTIGPTGSAADYTCDGTADNVEIQAALDACPAGATIAFLSGNYNIASQVSQTAKNLSLTGFGTVTFTIATGSDAPAFYFYGAVADTELLSASASKGDITITLTDASNVVVGDMLRITNSDIWCVADSNLVTGEMYTVLSKSGNIITLNQHLMRDYPTTKASTAQIIRPVIISVSNLEFNHQGATGNYVGLQLKYAKDCIIENCTFRNNGQSSVSLYSCFNVDVSTNDIFDSRAAGLGYGIVACDASAYINMHDNYIANCRHAITTGYSDIDVGLNRDIIINNNVLVGGTLSGYDVIDSHVTTINHKVTNNIIYVADGNLGFSDGTRNSTFANNTVYGGAAAYSKNANATDMRTTIANNHIYDTCIICDSGTTENESIQILGNICTGSTTYGIGISTQKYKSIIISGNTISTCTGEGIRIYLPATAANHENITITGNTITAAGRNGIFIRNYSTTKYIRAAISGNVINGVDTVNDSCSGIHLYNIVRASVSGNTIYDDTAGMHAAIAEDTSCNYNSFVGNVCGGGSYGIVTVGANTVKLGNIE